MKRARILIFLALAVIIYGCSSGDKKPTYAEGSLENQAIEISRALYTGNEEFVLQCSDEKTHEYLQNTIKSNEGIKIRGISITSTSQENGKHTVILEITDSKDYDIIYHQMIFEKLEDTWKLIEFGIDT